MSPSLQPAWRCAPPARYRRLRRRCRPCSSAAAGRSPRRLPLPPLKNRDSRFGAREPGVVTLFMSFLRSLSSRNLSPRKRGVGSRNLVLPESRSGDLSHKILLFYSPSLWEGVRGRTSSWPAGNLRCSRISSRRGSCPCGKENRRGRLFWRCAVSVSPEVSYVKYRDQQTPATMRRLLVLL